MVLMGLWVLWGGDGWWRGVDFFWGGGVGISMRFVDGEKGI